jgi:hypothetical protein
MFKPNKEKEKTFLDEKPKLKKVVGFNENPTFNQVFNHIYKQLNNEHITSK